MFSIHAKGNNYKDIMQKGNKLLILTFTGPVRSFGSGRFLKACIKEIY
jgi:hypothetical protein